MPSIAARSPSDRRRPRGRARRARSRARISTTSGARSRRGDARLRGLHRPQVRAVEPGAGVPAAARAARGLRPRGASATTAPTTSTSSPRRRSSPSPTASSTTAIRSSSTCRSRDCWPPAYAAARRALDRPRTRLARAAPRRSAPRPRAARRRGDLRRARLGTRHGLRRRGRRRAQHGVVHAERRVDPDLAGDRRARLPARHARADVLPRPAPSERARARQAPAHDADADAGHSRRRAGHGLRHAGRRPAGPVDAAGVPQPRRVRDGRAGGDRGGALLVGALPVELLSASRDARRAARRGTHPRGGARRARRARPRVVVEDDWVAGDVLCIRVDRAHGVLRGGADPRGEVSRRMPSYAIGW